MANDERLRRNRRQRWAAAGRVWIALTCASVSACATTIVEKESPSPEAFTEYILRGDVARALERSHGPTPFAMLAELEQGATRAAVFWPWLPKRDGSIDDDVMAIIFNRTITGGYTPSRLYKVSGSERKQFIADLGDGFRVIRPPGISATEASGFLTQHIERSRRAHARNNVEEVLRSTESLARFFENNFALWRDEVTELVLTAIRSHSFTIEHDPIEAIGDRIDVPYVLIINSDGTYERRQRGTFKIIRRGESWRIVSTTES